MARFVSPFTPRSQYGGALSNLMTAAFADSNEGGSKRSAAQDVRDTAEAEKAIAETMRLRQGTQGRQDFVQNIAKSIVPENEVPLVMNRRRTGMWDAFEDPRRQQSVVPGIGPLDWKPEYDTQLDDAAKISAALLASDDANFKDINAATAQPGKDRQIMAIVESMLGKPPASTSATPEPGQAQNDAFHTDLGATGAGTLPDTTIAEKPQLDLENIIASAMRLAAVDPTVSNSIIGAANSARQLYEDDRKAKEGRRDPVLEQKIKALVNSGVPLELAQGIAAGRYQLAIDPINGSRGVIDIATGEVKGSVGPAPSAAKPPASAMPTDVNAAAATGGSGFFGNIANTIVDAIGMGIPFEKVEQGKNALTNLAVQTSTLLQDAVPGRPSNFLMQKLDALTINPGSLLQGDARALDRLSQTRNMLRVELERMQRDILLQPGNFKPEEVTKTRLSYSRLQQLLREYDTVIDSFPAAHGVAPVQGGGWTVEKEQRLQELRRRAQ